MAKRTRAAKLEAAVERAEVRGRAVHDGPGEFPKMLYASKGRQKVVASAEDQAAAGKDWYEHPDEA